MHRQQSTRAHLRAQCRDLGILRPDGNAPDGITIWQGPSAWNRSPLVLVASWSGCTSSGDGANAKTGRMVQTYILRRDSDPVADLHSGADEAICGDCPHRPQVRRDARAAGEQPHAPCYVNVGQGPRAIADGHSRGLYPLVDIETAADILAGVLIRFGTYGDPGMVPSGIWSALADCAAGHTGYTHRAHDFGADLVGLAMASADSLNEARDLQADGWQTFRVSTDPDEPRDRGEARCPASAEAGKRVTCEACPLKCDGAASDHLVGRVILDHGPGGIGRRIGARLN